LAFKSLSSWHLIVKYFARILQFFSIVTNKIYVNSVQRTSKYFGSCIFLVFSSSAIFFYSLVLTPDWWEYDDIEEQLEIILDTSGTFWASFSQASANLWTEHQIFIRGIFTNSCCRSFSSNAQSPFLWPTFIFAPSVTKDDTKCITSF